MNKKFQIIAFAALLMAVAPLRANEAMEMESPDTETTSITVNGKSAHVCGANGMTLEIYNLAGMKVSSIKIDAADKVISLNLTKGTYIIKVGDIVRKISIR